MKSIIFPLIATILLFGSSYSGSTISAVTLAGGILKAKQVEVVKKYKRKNCPVCKGTGKYLSGDGIKMVDCGYCEPEKTQEPINGVIQSGTTISKKIICGPDGCRILRQ